MSLKKAADFFLLFVLLFFTQRIALAQSQENNGYSADDAILVDSLNARALAFRYLDLDSLSFFAKKSYKLAEKNNYISGKVIAARLIAVELMYKGQFSEGIDLLFKEKLDLDTVNYIRENAIIDYNLGLIYSASGNYKAGLPYLNKSLAVVITSLMVNYGYCYYGLEKYDSA